jgi:hypothetical protein
MKKRTKKLDNSVEKCGYMGRGTFPPLMPHAERRALIERPFLTQRIPGKSWKGVLISEDVPTGGRRDFNPDAIEDESYIRYGRREDT